MRDKLKNYSGDTDIKIQKDDIDVIDALIALGYIKTQAHRALSKVSSDIEDTNGQIKAALNELS